LFGSAAIAGPLNSRIDTTTTLRQSPIIELPRG
jgi:hypothetical protein